MESEKNTPAVPLTLALVCKDRLSCEEPVDAPGWGDDASETLITGDIQEIIIVRKGEPQISIRIGADGTVWLHDMGGLCFETDVPRALKLTPYRKWEA